MLSDATIDEQADLNLRPLRPELPAAATMLVAEHGRPTLDPARWRVAMVVLRYFVAVPILRGWVTLSMPPEY